MYLYKYVRVCVRVCVRVWERVCIWRAEYRVECTWREALTATNSATSCYILILHPKPWRLVIRGNPNNSTPKHSKRGRSKHKVQTLTTHPQTSRRSGQWNLLKPNPTPRTKPSPLQHSAARAHEHVCTHQLIGAHEPAWACRCRAQGVWARNLKCKS